ncbi:hypothetical protein P280DRAFT_542082 [Massarina eburnea CBS 473.64]|uniref:Uncharacterized protein n=1 Tax=Massarina eburnea CBS 473.64 TaxID=1395130 RepID=A0A6A6S102_9PLEO|nr:hypothetical protein P280DRAFT_542082 [Massarina eburnea CBS 473.64]
MPSRRGILRPNNTSRVNMQDRNRGRHEEKVQAQPQPRARTRYHPNDPFQYLPTLAPPKQSRNSPPHNPRNGRLNFPNSHSLYTTAPIIGCKRRLTEENKADARERLERVSRAHFHDIRRSNEAEQAAQQLHREAAARAQQLDEGNARNEQRRVDRERRNEQLCALGAKLTYDNPFARKIGEFIHGSWISLCHVLARGRDERAIEMAERRRAQAVQRRRQLLKEKNLREAREKFEREGFPHGISVPDSDESSSRGSEEGDVDVEDDWTVDLLSGEDSGDRAGGEDNDEAMSDGIETEVEDVIDGHDNLSAPTPPDSSSSSSSPDPIDRIRQLTALAVAGRLPPIGSRTSRPPPVPSIRREPRLVDPSPPPVSVAPEGDWDLYDMPSPRRQPQPQQSVRTGTGSASTGASRSVIGARTGSQARAAATVTQTLNPTTSESETTATTTTPGPQSASPATFSGRGTRYWRERIERENDEAEELLGSSRGNDYGDGNGRPRRMPRF